MTTQNNVLDETSSLDEWLEYIDAIHPQNISMGLKRTQQVAERLAITRPRSRVITISGTNGKGSSVSMIEKGLSHFGFSHISYTSPHFQHFNERIRHNSKLFNDAAIIQAFCAIRNAANQAPTIPLTYFEFSTLAAIWLAADTDVDYLILEVGLGGRLDAVNIIDADFTLLTNIGLDHQDRLGATREAIGFEKAGVFRGGRLAIIGEHDVPNSVTTHASNINAVIARIGEQFEFSSIGPNTWQWRGAGFVIDDLDLPDLAVPLQNIAAVIYLFTQLVVLSERSLAKLITSLLQTQMPGRFQHIEKKQNYYLDVAHNAESAQVLLGNIIRLPVTYVTHMVVGMLADKPVENVVSLLCSGLAEQKGTQVQWHLVGLTDVCRGLSVRDLAERVEPLIGNTAMSHDTTESALRHLQTHAAASDNVIVFGSFFTVAKGLHELDVTLCFN